MILRISEDGTYIEADSAGADYLINGMAVLRDSEPGTVVSQPYINGEGAGVFRLVRVEDLDA